MTTEVPPVQGAPRETDFVKSTAEEVERRERGVSDWLARSLAEASRNVALLPQWVREFYAARDEVRRREYGKPRTEGR